MTPFASTDPSAKSLAFYARKKSRNEDKILTRNQVVLHLVVDKANSPIFSK